MDYEGVRIPKYTYDSVPIVKAKAIANQANLPRQVLAPEVCPLCSGAMQGIEATVRLGYRSCASCGYGQPIFQLEHARADVGPALADLGKGALIALGIAALAYLVGTALENRAGRG